MCFKRVSMSPKIKVLLSGFIPNPEFFFVCMATLCKIVIYWFGDCRCTFVMQVLQPYRQHLRCRTVWQLLKIVTWFALRTARTVEFSASTLMEIYNKWYRLRSLVRHCMPLPTTITPVIRTALWSDTGGLHQPHLDRHLANGHLTLSSH